MNRSIRCPHGFCRSEVPCEQCGDNPNRLPKGRSTRPHVAPRVTKVRYVPPGYARADGARKSEAQQLVDRRGKY